MNGRKLTPSRVARAYAASAWPDVQSQRKLAPSIFDFSCAGHGGIVAVLDSANLPPELVSIARRHGKTEFVGLYYSQLITSERYTRATFERMRAAGMPIFEVWVGEEDCDWALIALADLSDRVCAALAAVAKPGGDYDTAAKMRAYALQNARRWNPDVVAEVAEAYSVDLAEVS